MQHLKIFLILVILGCSLNVSAGEKEIIRLSNGEWPPWLSGDLPDYGIASHIITEAFAVEGIIVEYGFFPWARAKQLAAKGIWDGTVVWSRTAEREREFYYSDKIIEVAHVFFHLKSYRFNWQSIADLKGIPIGATLSYNYGDEFAKAEKNGLITVKRVPKDETNLKKILTGRIKIFPLGRQVGYHMIKKNFSPAEAELFTYHPNLIKKSPTYHLLISKKINSERAKRLLAQFNRGLRTLKESGRYDQLLNRLDKGQDIHKEKP